MLNVKIRPLLFNPGLCVALNRPNAKTPIFDLAEQPDAIQDVRLNIR
jgi:hypothetical protein